mmetsp:Transcript_41908/g.121152  ORF Transcript_41908/g.121152 Transcript_41908/m.121152 type:complete len:202 (+) Transcript_41908:556-1161(+)
MAPTTSSGAPFVSAAAWRSLLPAMEPASAEHAASKTSTDWTCLRIAAANISTAVLASTASATVSGNRPCNARKATTWNGPLINCRDIRSAQNPQAASAAPRRHLVSPTGGARSPRAAQQRDARSASLASISPAMTRRYSVEMGGTCRSSMRLCSISYLRTRAMTGSRTTPVRKPSSLKSKSGAASPWITDLVLATKLVGCP